MAGYAHVSRAYPAFSMHRLSQSAGGRGDRFCRRPGKKERAESVSNGKAWWQNDGADEK